MKKLSVITIVFNAAEVVERTIKSVISQTVRDTIEYIVIDGASTDKTLDIIKKYESDIDIILSEPDDGIYDAMNKGVDLASGEWVCFINADDTYAGVDVLAKSITVAKNADVIYGKTNFMSENGDFLYQDSPERIETIFNKMPFGHPSTLTKASLLKKIKFNTNFRIAADYDFFLRAYVSGARFRYIDLTIAEFRLGGVSSVAIHSTAIETIYSILRNKSVEVAKKSLFYKNLTYLSNLVELNELNESFAIKNSKLKNIDIEINELSEKIQEFYSSKIYGFFRAIIFWSSKIIKR